MVRKTQDNGSTSRVSQSRVIAIDWSGALQGAHRKIWLAEAFDGVVERLEGGRDRAQIESHLLDIAERDRHVVIGLDFAFSMPAWFLRERGIASAHELWARVASGEGERWLRDCEPPFWGRPGKKRPHADPARRAVRRCEEGLGAKPVFQVGGAGAVGTGSLRGMPMLHRLHAAGFHIWPCDAPGWPLVVEIYPRACTGSVVKSSAAERARYIDRWVESNTGASVSDDLLGRARNSEDAFDALFSVLAMSARAEQFAALPAIHDQLKRLEGAIWHPGLSLVASI